MFVLHEYNWNVLPFLSLVNLLMIIVYLGTLRDCYPASSKGPPAAMDCNVCLSHSHFL